MNVTTANLILQLGELVLAGSVAAVWSLFAFRLSQSAHLKKQQTVWALAKTSAYACVTGAFSESVALLLLVLLLIASGFLATIATSLVPLGTLVTLETGEASSLTLSMADYHSVDINETIRRYLSVPKQQFGGVTALAGLTNTSDTIEKLDIRWNGFENNYVLKGIANWTAGDLSYICGATDEDDNYGETGWHLAKADNTNCTYLSRMQPNELHSLWPARPVRLAQRNDPLSLFRAYADSDGHTLDTFSYQERGLYLSNSSYSAALEMRTDVQKRAILVAFRNGTRTSEAEAGLFSSLEDGAIIYKNSLSVQAGVGRQTLKAYAMLHTHGQYWALGIEMNHTAALAAQHRPPADSMKPVWRQTYIKTRYATYGAKDETSMEITPARLEVLRMYSVIAAGANFEWEQLTPGYDKSQILLWLVIPGLFAGLALYATVWDHRVVSNTTTENLYIMNNARLEDCASSERRGWLELMKPERWARMAMQIAVSDDHVTLLLGDEVLIAKTNVIPLTQVKSASDLVGKRSASSYLRASAGISTERAGEPASPRAEMSTNKSNFSV